MNVRAAVEAFGSELRVQLIHHFLQNPGTSQADAYRAVGASQRSVSDNTKALAGVGLLVEEPGRTSRTVRYIVDQERLAELKRELNTYLTPADLD